jgi:hypothetical protein
VLGWYLVYVDQLYSYKYLSIFLLLINDVTVRYHSLMSRKDFDKYWKRLQKFAKTFGDEGSYYERTVKHGKRIFCSIDGHKIYFQRSGTPSDVRAYRNFLTQSQRTLISIGMSDEFSSIKFLTHVDLSNDGKTSKECLKEITNLLEDIQDEIDRPYKVTISYVRHGKKISYDRYYRWGVREDNQGLRSGFVQIKEDEYKLLDMK